MFERRWASHFLGLGALGLAACSFDSAGLEQRLCASDEDCPSGSCEAGVCRIASATDDVRLPDDAEELDGDLPDDSTTDTPRDGHGEDAAPDVDADVDAPDAPLCGPDDLFCDGDSAWTCDDAGERVLVEDCSLATCGEFGCVCDEGACEPLLCRPGTSRCIDFETAEVCDADGRSAPETVACEEATVCIGGTCVDDTCEPDTARCEGEVSILCDSEGTFGLVEDCSAAGAYCAEGVCTPRICEPGAVACASDVDVAGNNLVTCSERGDAWEVSSGCGVNNTCVDGECLPLICSPGSAICAVDGRSVLACNASGTERVPEDCGEERYCRSVDAACVPRVCTPGETRCRDVGRVETCNELGSRYDDATECGDGQVCVESACIDTLCPPGRTYCADEFTSAVCSESGDEVVSTEACPFGCVDGVCSSSFCGDGIVDPANGELCDDGNDDPCDGCHDCLPTNGLQLDGSVRVTSNARWVPARSNFTYEGWVNVLSENGALFGLGQASEADSVLMRVTDGIPIFSYRNDRNAIIRAVGRERITGAGWVHLAGVRYGEREAALYVNGRLQTVMRLDTRVTSIDSTQGRIWVGTDGELDRSAATIDEVRISNNVRYAADFTPPPRHAPDANTIAYYRFDQLEGGVVRSESGSRDLTVEGASFTSTGCFGGDAENWVCGDGVRAPWEQCESGDAGCVACRPTSRCAHNLRFDDGGSEGGCYVVLTQTSEWEDAQATCNTWGGHLATINNAAENTYLRGRLAGNFWIGLNDCCRLRDEGNFRWVSGLSSSFRNWASGEPNDGGSVFSTEDCVEVRGDGLWNDQGCGSDRFAVCERAN